MRAVDVRMEGPTSHFAIELRSRGTKDTDRIDGLSLPMPGLHNLLNATAGIAVAHHLGMSHAAIREGLARFSGVKRRFTHTGSWLGVDIYDDYGHHPVEIAAVLKAARTATSGKVIAVVQPHRYTRLRDLFDQFAGSFNDADCVLVAPVYEAGEQLIEGATHTDLVSGIHAQGHRHVEALDRPEALAGRIAQIAQAGDTVLCLGAGSITAWRMPFLKNSRRWAHERHRW